SVAAHGLRGWSEQRGARGAAAPRRARLAERNVEADDGGAGATERDHDPSDDGAVPGPGPEARLARGIAHDDHEGRRVGKDGAPTEPAVVHRPVQRGDGGAAPE